MQTSKAGLAVEPFWTLLRRQSFLPLPGIELRLFGRLSRSVMEPLDAALNAAVCETSGMFAA